MRRDTPYLSVFSPNTGQRVPEKTPYLDNFHAVTLTLLKPLNDTNNLVIKTDYDTKISEIEKKITNHDHSILLLKNLIG